MRFKSIDCLPMAGSAKTNDKSISSEIGKKKRKANTKGWLERKEKELKKAKKADLCQIAQGAKLCQIVNNFHPSNYIKIYAVTK